MTGLYRNIANLVVLLRVLLILAAILLLDSSGFALRITGLAILAVAAFLDGVDGYLARRLSIVSRIGGQLDTLGDRVTENVLFVFFAVQGLVSFWVPIIFVTRSFIADFVRAQHDRCGTIGTFAMNTSILGTILVASKVSRAGYLFLKFSVFLAGGCYLALTETSFSANSPEQLATLRAAIWWGAGFTTVMNLLRFAALIYDSSDLLKKEFGL